MNFMSCQEPSRFLVPLIMLQKSIQRCCRDFSPLGGFGMMPTPQSKSLTFDRLSSLPMLVGSIPTLPLRNRFGAPACICCCCAGVGETCCLWIRSADHCTEGATRASVSPVQLVQMPVS